MQIITYLIALSSVVGLTFAVPIIPTPPPDDKEHHHKPTSTEVHWTNPHTFTHSTGIHSFPHPTVSLHHQSIPEPSASPLVADREASDGHHYSGTHTAHPTGTHSSPHPTGTPSHHSGDHKGIHPTGTFSHHTGTHTGTWTFLHPTGTQTFVHPTSNTKVPHKPNPIPPVAARDAAPAPVTDLDLLVRSGLTGDELAAAANALMSRETAGSDGQCIWDCFYMTCECITNAGRKGALFSRTLAGLALVGAAVVLV